MSQHDYESGDIESAAHLAYEGSARDRPSDTEISEDDRPPYSPETLQLIRRVIDLARREELRKMSRG